jgi:hypothetical protein
VPFVSLYIPFGQGGQRSLGQSEVAPGLQVQFSTCVAPQYSVGHEFTGQGLGSTSPSTGE